MKKIFLILGIILSPFIMNSQTVVDLNEMVENVLLGEPLGFEAVCDGTPNAQFVADTVHFNGHRVILNNGTLRITDFIEFGGGFKGYCSSKLIISGLIRNSDPPDPVGDPFSTNGPPVIPNPYFVDEITIDLPDAQVVGWYELYDLINSAINDVLNDVLNVNNNNIDVNFFFDQRTHILTVKNVDAVKIFNLSGQEMLSRRDFNNEVTMNLSKLPQGVYFGMTNTGGRFKIIK